MENARDRAYRLIKDMIIRYEWVPGQKVTYQELAKKLQMSKTPIINALNRLEQEEFVVSVPNRGFFAKEVDIQEVSELFHVREALEILSIEEAIRNQTPQKLKQLQRTMNLHKETDYSTPTTTRYRWGLDVLFHLKIAEMTCNQSLVKLLRRVCELNYLRHRIEGIPLKRLKETAEEHLGIFHAIAQKDISRAKLLVKKHLRAGRMSTIKGIQTAKMNFGP